MKREAIHHTKMKKLCHRLQIPTYHAVGILESLWHLTARQAIRGNIGSLSNEDIAVGIDYKEDENILIKELTYCGWIDEDPIHRLLIHDWEQHADDAVKKRLNRAKLAFIGGQRRTTADNGGRSLPIPEPEPEPVPEENTETLHKGRSTVGKPEILPVSVRLTYLSDDSYRQFAGAALAFWKDLIVEEDLQKAWQFTWLKFSFEQKLDAHKRLQARIEAHEDPKFVTRLPRYLEDGHWKRPPRKPNRTPVNGIHEDQKSVYKSLPVYLPPED